jgi:hypothetical protein
VDRKTKIEKKNKLTYYKFSFALCLEFIFFQVRFKVYQRIKYFYVHIILKQKINRNSINTEVHTLFFGQQTIDKIIVETRE